MRRGHGGSQEQPAPCRPREGGPRRAQGLPTRLLVLRAFAEAAPDHPRVTPEFRGTNLLGLGVWTPKTLPPQGKTTAPACVRLGQGSSLRCRPSSPDSVPPKERSFDSRGARCTVKPRDVR